MTTINSIEDLIKLLDEKPEWLEAVRARILTRELLELPQTLAEFIETTNRRFEEIDQQFGLIGQRLGAVENRLGEVEAETKSLRSEMEQGFASIRRDLGVLKGAHARTSALRQSTAITDGLGLTRIRDLDYEELRDLTVASDTSDIPSNDIMSFRLADLVMEASDQNGETQFVAVDISYTVNGRDTRRAIRNAEFLTRFTGHPSFAVVAGIDLDDRIKEAVDDGEVTWYQLHMDDLETE